MYKNHALMEFISSNQDDFHVAIREWLSGTVTGHLGSNMYTADTDDKCWKNGHSSPMYYYGRDEKAVFEIMLRDLDVISEILVDLGPGGDTAVIAKSAPLAKAIMAKTYFPVDSSHQFASSALRSMEKTLGIPGSPLIANFFNPISSLYPGAMIAIMGGTIGNLETHASKKSLQSRLRKIFAGYAGMVDGHGYFLVSFDANTNAQEIIDCYKNEEFGQLVRNCVERAIDTSDFSYDVTWSSHNYQLATGLRSMHDQIVHFYGERFAIKRNEFLPVLNSYRFPVSFIKEAATTAGWRHRNTWTATGRVHYLLFEIG